jgi:hypothetical protein
MTPGLAVYRRTGQQCPDGFIDGGRIHQADDPRCGGVDDCGWERCVRASTLRADNSVGGGIRLRTELDAAAASEPLGAQPHATSPYGGFCPVFEAIETPNEEVLIARVWITLGANERAVGATGRHRS